MCTSQDEMLETKIEDADVVELQELCSVEDSRVVAGLVTLYYDRMTTQPSSLASAFY